MPWSNRHPGALVKGGAVLDQTDTPAYHTYLLWLGKYPLFPLDSRCQRLVTVTNTQWENSTTAGPSLLIPIILLREFDHRFR